MMGEMSDVLQFWNDLEISSPAVLSFPNVYVPHMYLLTGTGCGTQVSAWFAAPSARSTRSSNSTKSSSWSCSGKTTSRKSCCSVCHPARFSSLSAAPPPPPTCLSAGENAKRRLSPPDQVDSALKCLSEKYDGPQPSDLCHLLEGEQFFASFQMGLDIRTSPASCSSSVDVSCASVRHAGLMCFCRPSAGREDYVQGRLCFVFHSSMKNVKEVFICPAQGQRGPVRGEVRLCAPQIRKNALPLEYSCCVLFFLVRAA